MPRVREETAMEPSQQGSLAAISNFYITESISDELDCKKAIVRESEGAKGRRGEGGGGYNPLGIMLFSNKHCKDIYS